MSLSIWLLDCNVYEQTCNEIRLLCRIVDIKLVLVWPVIYVWVVVEHENTKSFLMLRQGTINSISIMVLCSTSHFSNTSVLLGHMLLSVTAKCLINKARSLIAYIISWLNWYKIWFEVSSWILSDACPLYPGCPLFPIQRATLINTESDLYTCYIYIDNINACVPQNSSLQFIK